jgi:2,4-dienoyl-CoA reductase-like NADH-dependent reductase (Old Yellow Enzyme family)
MTTLFDPLRLKSGATAKNRLALAPMTNQQSHDDGTVSDDELRWLRSRADGGFGVVFTCAAHVAKDGQGWPGELGCFSDALVPSLTKVATTLRQAGALSLLQIFHGGARADRSVSGVTPWSCVAGEDPAGPVRAGSDEDIVRVVGEFADAAGRAQAAGFDGVEIHGAHGYLLTQFLSQLNTRGDRWGGPLEHRARLLRDVVSAVRARVGARFVVGVRVSPEDFGNARGLDLDESLQVARWLGDDGALDFVHVSLWQAQNHTTKRPTEHPLSLYRQALPKDVALFTAGSVWTRAEATALVDKGADVVAVGRAALVNPSWARQIEVPSVTPKRPPVTTKEVVDGGVGPAFAKYMGRWKGFVVD